MTIVAIYSFIAVSYYYHRKTSLAEPAYIFNVVWLFVSLAFFYLDDAITPYTQLFIVSCIFTFSASSSNGVRYNLPRLSTLVDSKFFVSLMWVFVFIYIFLIPAYYREVFGGGTFESLIELRNSMTESAANGVLSPLISLGINIPIVFSVFISYNSRYYSRLALFVFFILSFFPVLISFSKGYLILFFLVWAVGLYINGVFSVRALKFAFLIFSLVLLLTFAARDSHVDTFLLSVMYTVAPTMALESLINGAHSLNQPMLPFFEPFYNLLGVPIVNGRSDFWAPIEYPTNVYTIFGLLFNDIGSFLTVVMFALLGLASRFVFRLVCIKQSSIYFFAYIWVLQAVLTSFFSDALLGFASTGLKYIFILVFLEFVYSMFRTRGTANE